MASTLLTLAIVLVSTVASAQTNVLRLALLPSLPVTSQVHSVAHLRHPQVVGFASDSGLLLWATAAQGRSHGVPALYELDFKSGRLSRLVSQQRSAEIPMATLSGPWLAWEQASSNTLFCRNLRSDIVRRIANYGVLGTIVQNILGLAFYGDDLYWLGTSIYQGSLVTAVYRLDPSTGHVDRVLTYDAESSGKVIFNMSVSDGIAYLSISNSPNPYDTGAAGTIVALNLSDYRVRQVMSLEHAAAFVENYGQYLAVVYNASKTPNGPSNPKPYPLIVYNLQTDAQTLRVQLDTTIMLPAMNNRYVVADALGPKTLVVNYRTGTISGLAASWVTLHGRWLSWGSGTTVYWRQA